MPELTPDYVVEYVVGAAVAEAQQYVHLFKPDETDFPPPASGYPVLLITEFGDYITNIPASTIPVSTRLEYRAVTELGIAVGLMGNTGTYSSMGSRNMTSIGGGLFHPPGTTGWDADTRYSSCKESVLAVQLLRHNSSTYGIDASKIVVQGDSTGSGAMGAPATWADQADAGQTDHRQASSRVLGAMLNVGQYDWGLYDQGETPPTNFNFFPEEVGDQMFDLAPTYSEARQDYIEWASPLVTLANSPAQRALNGSTTALWMHMGFAGTTTTDMTLSGSYGATTAKRPTALGSLDPNAGVPFANASKHEAAQIVLMAKQIQGIDVDGYHAVHDRYWVDLAAGIHINFNDPDGAALMTGLLELSETSATVVDKQLNWLSYLYTGDPDQGSGTAQAGGESTTSEQSSRMVGAIQGYAATSGAASGSTTHAVQHATTPTAEQSGL